MKNKMKNDPNAKPIAWVPQCSLLGAPPSWHLITFDEKKAQYWLEKCGLGVVPLFAGELEKPL